MPDLSHYIGLVTYDHCNGFFGRLPGSMRFEAFGSDWVVARDLDNNFPRLAHFDKGWQLDKMEELIEGWGWYADTE